MDCDNMFKIGDKVRITGNSNFSCNEIGDIGIIQKVSKTWGEAQYQVVVSGRYIEGSTDCWTMFCDMEKVDDMYEDAWILNDGKVTIPDDAQKTMHEGSVVAFRKRKQKPLQFGDILIGNVTRCKYKFITKNRDHYVLLELSSDTVIQNCRPENYTRK